jgi:hypothetical protein
MIAVLAVGTALAPAFAANVTVGQFYTELAQAKHLVSVDAASAEANLRGAGFNLPKLGLDKALTEGDMASISKALGVAVTTQRPSELITETQLNTYMASFGGQIGGTTVKVGDPLGNPNQVLSDHPVKVKKVKKPKKKKNKSPNEPI